MLKAYHIFLMAELLADALCDERGAAQTLALTRHAYRHPTAAEPSTENQECRFVLLREATNGLMMPAEQVSDILRPAVPQTNPHHLGRSAAKHAEAMEVLVLRHDQAPALARELPDGEIRSSLTTHLADMRGLGKQVVQEDDQPFGQGLVEEKAHQVRPPTPRRFDVLAQPRRPDRLARLRVRVEGTPLEAAPRTYRQPDIRARRRP